MRLIEGVPYSRYVVRYRLVDGRRRRLVRWSPGYPWIRSEVARELVDLHGFDGIKHGSVTIQETP